MTLSIISALLFTILIEVCIAIIFVYRKKLEIATIILINIITNPLLNYFLLLNNHYEIIKIDTLVILFLEIAVVYVEWLLLKYTLQQNPKKLFILSIAMNFCSYFLGILIFR